MRKLSLLKFLLPMVLLLVVFAVWMGYSLRFISLKKDYAAQVQMAKVLLYADGNSLLARYKDGRNIVVNTQEELKKIIFYLAQPNKPVKKPQGEPELTLSFKNVTAELYPSNNENTAIVVLNVLDKTSVMQLKANNFWYYFNTKLEGKPLKTK